MSEATVAQVEVSPLDSWTELDKEWLEKHVPEILRPAAVRHGRKLFQLVMMAGACNHALIVIGNQARGNRAVSQASFVLQNSLDTMAKALLIGNGHTGEQYNECKEDVERIAALADNGSRQPNDKVSKGGIILNS